MIEKISQITNFGVFKDFKWNPSLKDYPFKEVNIIYGRNYSGKTTLSRMMRAFETGFLSDKYGSPSFSLKIKDNGSKTEKDYSSRNPLIRVFNEDFVRENFSFFSNSENSSIKPFAVVGSDNTRLQNEIDVILQEIGNSEEGSESGLYKKKVDAKAALTEAQRRLNEATSKLSKQKNTKATDSKEGIKYHSDLYGDQNYTIRKLETDIDYVVKNSIASLSDDEIEKLKESLKENILPAVSFNEPSIFKYEKWEPIVAQLVSKKIGESEKIQELMHDAILNEWVHTGLSVNKGREKCAFCGQPITENRWKELFGHFDNEYETLKKDISTTITKLEAEKNIVESINFENANVYRDFYEKIDALNASLQKEKEKACIIIDRLISFLNKKKNNIIECFELPNNNERIEITPLFHLYKEILKESNQYGSSLSERKKKIRDKLRYSEISKFITLIDYHSQVSNIESLTNSHKQKNDELTTIENDISSNLTKIEQKRREMHDEKKGADKVNLYLNNFFGHKSLSLQPRENQSEGVTNVFFEIIRHGNVAYNLSEGEKSLIAFCYFIAKLDDVETCGKNPIIWIDDPISSLDGNHIYFVYSLISSVILDKADYEQLFITTHNLEFLKYINRMGPSKNQKNRPVGTSSYIIERCGDISTIKKMPKYLKDHGSEFQYWFSKIYSCAQQTEMNDDNMPLFESFGNSARKFFETYLYYKYPDDKNLDDHMKKFFSDDSISKFLLDKFGDENSHASGDLEMRSLPYDAPEIIDIAKKILNVLEKNDPEQYQILTSNSIS